MERVYIGLGSNLADPVGQVIDRSERPNGLVMERVRVPVGVLAIIYESRPNVTADAAALGLRSGNAVILRGGSEAVHSNRAIHAAMVEGIVSAGLPADAVQLVPTQDRAAVGALLKAQGQIDMVIPRGGKSLVARVQDEARVPVLAHLDGICHTYIHASADPAMVRRYKRLIDDGYALPFGDAIALEQARSSAANRAVRAEEVEARRMAVMQRGRANI